MESKIWLDVTTILNWNRPAVGIIRVESECASHFLKLNASNIHFCRFDLESTQYFEVQQDYVREALLRIQQSNIRPLSTSVSIISKQQRLKKIALSFIHLLPRRLQKKTLEFLIKRLNAYQAAIRSYHEMRIAIREFVKPAPHPTSHPILRKVETVNKTESLFKSTDIYISMGLDWDHKNLEYLYSIKQEIGFKIILFCYDIIPVKYQQLFFGNVSSMFGHYFANLAWCADKVLCISECTKRDLTRLLSDLAAPLPEMSVIKLGCELPAMNEDKLSPEVKSLSGKRFIMMVSTIERRKNHEVLYRAYTRLIDQGIKELPLLVFIGMYGWGASELLSDLKLDSRTTPYIRIMDHVSDSDLMWLYKNSEFTVFPSLYEGWGIPVAESLAAGKFCLASNAASIPEVGGDLIEYLDPWDLPEWTNRLRWYFEHPDDLAHKEEQIRNGFRPTNWSETAFFVLKTANELRGKNDE